MNNTETTTPDTNAAGEGMPDTRPALIEALDVAVELVSATNADHLANATPCPEYTVKDLQDHLILVARRVTAMGRGESWDVVQPEPIAVENQVDQLSAAADDVRNVWADPGRLGQMMDAPFATLPGAALAGVYASELLTHSWDLAAATDRPVVASEQTLAIAYQSIQMLPGGESDRDADDMPFGRVVQVPEDAPTIERIVAWTGRDPKKWA